MHLLGESPLIVAPVALAGETLGALNVTARWLTAGRCTDGRRPG